LMWAKPKASKTFDSSVTVHCANLIGWNETGWFWQNTDRDGQRFYSYAKAESYGIGKQWPLYYVEKIE
jgi:hypothetical protein